MWHVDTWLPAPPEDVLELLTDPQAIARWSPVGFELLELDGERLDAGRCARVRGELAGRRVEFTVLVQEAGPERLALTASGPIDLDVDYRFCALDRGSEVRAAVGVRGRGFIGGLIARAAEALLAAGALDHALARMGSQLAPATC